MKIPTLEEVHPPLADAAALKHRAHAERRAKQAEALAIAERIRTLQPDESNVVTNRVRRLIGEDSEPEVLSDPDRLYILRREIDALTRDLPALDALHQREKATASRMLCGAVEPQHMALVRDFASKLSALHDSHTKYVAFLDGVEATGAASGYLNPVWSKGLGDPRDMNGAYFYAFKEMREAGHIDYNDIPKAIRN